MYTPPKYLPEDWSQPIKGSIVDELITHYVNRTLIHEDRWDDLKAALKSAMLEIVPKKLPADNLTPDGTFRVKFDTETEKSSTKVIRHDYSEIKGFNAARDEMIKNINTLFGEG